MANKKGFPFENLPPHIIDRIFQYLSFTEIARVSVVSKFFLRVGDTVIRKNFFSLHLEIHKELNRLKSELHRIPRTAESISRRIPFLRSYYILERHLSELMIMKAVWRSIIYDKARCSICIAKLLEEFTMAVTAAKGRNLPQWSISNEIELKISRISKVYLESKIMDLQLDCYFGSRIIDLMDSYINKNYEIRVKYYVHDNSCIIDSIYEMEKPHVVHVLPEMADTAHCAPSPEDRRIIYVYLIKFVRVNNRIALREEQYRRERSLDSSGWDLLEEDLVERHLWGTNDVRAHHVVLPNPQRLERRIDGKYVFEETYRSPEISQVSEAEKKFVCTIHLECPLNEAPLSTIDCWKRIQNELISTRHNDTELLEQVNSWISFSDLSSKSDSVCLSGEYMCDCTIEIVTNDSDNHSTQRLIIREP